MSNDWVTASIDKPEDDALVFIHLYDDSSRDGKQEPTYARGRYNSVTGTWIKEDNNMDVTKYVTLWQPLI